MNDSETLNLNKERILQLKVTALLSEEQPENDPWLKIKNEIQSEIKNANRKPETSYYTPKWIPWAIAASLVVSIGSLTMSWNNLQQAKVLYSDINNQSTPRTDSNRINLVNETAQDQIQIIDQSYYLAKANLIHGIERFNAPISKHLMSDIEANLVGIEQAALLIKAAIQKQPENSRLPLLLKATYDQELVVLTQIAKLDSSI